MANASLPILEFVTECASVITGEVEATYFAYADRRARFLERMEEGSIAIFPTAPEVRRSNDTEFPFRPDTDFFFLTGFEEPESVAVIAPGHDDGDFTLFVRPKDPTLEVWTGIRAGTEGAKLDYAALQEQMDGTVWAESVTVDLMQVSYRVKLTDPEQYQPLVATRWNGMDLMNYSSLIHARDQENIAIAPAIHAATSAGVPAIPPADR